MDGLKITASDLPERLSGLAERSGDGRQSAFVENYDEQLAQYMTHGVYLWLNNRLPPMEASGTSGMKASLNGVPNLSILDGWWIEGFKSKNGWSFGKNSPDSENRDDADAVSLYNILEKEVVPLYFKIGDDAIPHAWIAVMKETIKSNAALFSARRMVKEYVNSFYQPALKTEAK